MRNRLALAVIAATTIAASAASAASLTINSVTGIWQNVAPATAVTGEGTNQIRWGNSTGQGQSGYNFDGAAPPPVTVNEGGTFNLGDFTHLNYPITGTTLSSTDLLVNIGIADGVNPDIIVQTSFSFSHIETPNNASPCAQGGVPLCPDLVTATLNVGASDTFMIGGTEYIFNVKGFSTDGGLTNFSSFLTAEGQANTAQLIGTFQTRTSVVPLPAAGWLMLAGIGGLAAMRRKKKCA